MAGNDKATILVVEDDAALRRILVRILDGGGFTTLAAGNAADGLALVQQRRGALDLAILDMMIPGMSGLDLACELDRDYPELKILYISGYVDSIAAAVISKRSPDHVLLKPFGGQALLDRVELLLGLATNRKTIQSTEQPLPVVRSGTSG